jgi:hypothetical protein
VLQVLKTDASRVRDRDNSLNAKSKVCNQDAPVKHDDSTVESVARRLQDATVFKDDDASILELEDRMIQGSENTVLVTTNPSQGSNSPIQSITCIISNIVTSLLTSKCPYRAFGRHFRVVLVIVIYAVPVKSCQIM